MGGNVKVPFLFVFRINNNTIGGKIKSIFISGQSILHELNKKYSNYILFLIRNGMMNVRVSFSFSLIN